MLRGNMDLSSEDLLGCIDWPAASTDFGNLLPGYLREVILDASADQRLHFLEWCTGMSALPCGGLKQQIRLRVWEDGADDDLPVVHTCTFEVHLPLYSTREQLRTKLVRAIDDRHAGFLIE